MADINRFSALLSTALSLKRLSYGAI
jgi:hypothetical protein